MRSLPKLIPGVHHKLPGDSQKHVKRIYAHAEDHGVELNLYIKGEGGDEEETEAEEAPEPPRARARDAGSGELGAESIKVAYWPGCVSRGFTPSCTARWRWSPSGSGSSWSSSTAPTAAAPA